MSSLRTRVLISLNDRRRAAMSKSSQMTEATNINARTRPLPRKNFRILFMVQRLRLQPTLPWSLLTLDGVRAEVAVAAAAAELPESAPSPEQSRKQQCKGESSAPTARQSLRAWHFTAEHLCLLGWPLAKPCSTLPFGPSGSRRFQPPDSSTYHLSPRAHEPTSTFL